MKHFTIQLICCGGIASIATAAPLSDLTFVSISNYYSRVAKGLSPKCVPLQATYSAPITPKAISEDNNFSHFGPVLKVQAPLSIIINKRTFEVIGMSDSLLRAYIETNTVQKVPKFSVSEVLNRAKWFLTVCDNSVPENCVLKSVTFNDNFRSQWEIRWAPTVAGYTYDDFSAPYVQSFAVCFHEEYGFCGYSCSLDFPPPKQTEVKISKEDAITRASKVAPLVMKTPFYQMARASGFKIAGIKNAELKIAAPNWLLDPARAVWIREKPPGETRLCWIVTFATVDTMTRKEIKLEPVEILVYIDALTGDVVGANFS